MSTSRTRRPQSNDSFERASREAPQEIESGRRRALQSLASGAPIEEVLGILVESAERVLPELKCSILLLDRESGTLYGAIAPSLPDFYNAAVDGLKIGPDIGSCGRAAFTGERVVVEDVATHPNWAAFSELAQRAGVGACWSEPILSSERAVLGTFAMYYDKRRAPSDFELEFIETTAQLAGLALESRRGQNERREFEQRLRQIIDLVPHMIFVKDRNGRFLLLNRAVAEAYSSTVEGLMGTNHSEYHEESDELAHMLADDRQVIDSGQAKHIPEESFKDASGETRFLETIKIPYRDSATSEDYAVLGVAVDITDRKRAEESLRHSEERFRQLAESIREVFWLTDWDNNEVLYISPAYEAIWGRSCESLYENPKSWSIDIHPEDRERVIEAFARNAGLGCYDEEYRIVRDDKIIWIHDRAFPIRDEAGHVYRVAGISEDVSARKRAELELEKARDELETRVLARTQSLRAAYRNLQLEVAERKKAEEALRSLASELVLAEERERRRLAQDLHDGLSQTITLAHMKLGVLRNSVEGKSLKELEEIARLIEDSNQMARSLTFQLSPPILHDLGFEAAVQWLVEDVQKKYGLNVILEDDGRSKPMDERVRTILFRAARELLINSAKHADASRVCLHLSRQNDRICVVVEDDGVAFDAEVAFDTGSEGARGFGLFSIRERLSSLGGCMEIESKPSEGTRVRLIVPIDEAGDEQGSGDEQGNGTRGKVHK